MVHKQFFEFIITTSNYFNTMLSYQQVKERKQEKKEKKEKQNILGKTRLQV